MYAVIDLGSNSFHLLIAEYSDGKFNVVGRCSEKIQLAEALCHTGLLSDKAIDRGIRCLSHFKNILSQHAITELRVVGTQALREASNASSFISLANSIGFDIKVISGPEEASLIFRGINDPLPLNDKTRLIIDIGGASTEIAIGKSDKVLCAHSLEMGCVKWRDKFFSTDICYAKNGVLAEQSACDILYPVISDLKRYPWDEIYSSSGSSKMLAHISKTNKWSQGTIDRRSIAQVAELLNDARSIADIRIVGLNPERLDLLAPGLAILTSIMRCLEIDSITHSRTALREGILSQMSGRRVDYRLQE